MAWFKNILLPIDFSQASLGAEQYAALLARRFQSEVTLLHVIEIPQYGGLEFASPLYDNLPRRRAECEGALEQVVQTHFPGIPSRNIIEVGDSAERILDYASQHNPDLILMPTHGWSVFREFLIGGVTAKVLHDAHCPVWTGVHLKPAKGLSTPAVLSNITCAIDLGPQSQETLSWAAWFAEEFGARLTVVHVLSVLGQHELANLELMKETAEAKLRLLMKGLPTTPCLEILMGDPAKAICAHVKESASDLLVIGRGTAGHAFGRLRSQTYAMIHQSVCPVVSI
jgi:nucleotide-binding universal stress UspA family protein